MSRRVDPPRLAQQGARPSKQEAERALQPREGANENDAGEPQRSPSASVCQLRTARERGSWRVGEGR